MRSCSSSVLVKQTAEQVTPADLGRLIVADEGQSGGWVRRLKTKRPVRPMDVVVLNVDSEHVLEVAASEDQQKPAKADRAMGSGWTRRVLMTPVWLVGSAHSRCNSAASKTKTFLGSRYRRIVKRRGKKRALIAVGNPGPHHLLSDPQARFVDLGADFHDRLHPQRRTRQLIRELEHLSGKQVTLHDAA